MQNLQNYLQSKIEVCPISLSLKKAKKSIFFLISISMFIQGVSLFMDNLHTGQLSRHFFFGQATRPGLTQITPQGWIFES